MICDAKIWDEIEEDDTVEMLDSQLRQVYLSFNSFEHCNYSILELCTHPFYELYGRHSAIEAQLLDATKQILSGASEFCSLSHLEGYSMDETRTEAPERFAVQEKFMARLLCTLNRQRYILWVRKVRAQGEARGFPLKLVPEAVAPEPEISS